MTPLQIFVLFYLLCIPVRIGLVLLAKKTQTQWLIPVAIIIGIGFLRQYILNSPGGFSQKPAWWQSLRLIHGLLWLTFAVSMITNPKCAWIGLLVDVIIGITASFLHYVPII